MNPKFHDTLFGTGACLLAFERYKKAKILPVGAAVLYDVFREKLKVQTLCSDQKARDEIRVKWTEIHKNQMLFVMQIEESKGEVARVEAILQVIESDFKNDKSLENVLKREFLRHYFNELIANGKELEL